MRWEGKRSEPEDVSLLLLPSSACRTYSSTFIVWVPAELDSRTALQAMARNESLNQFVEEGAGPGPRGRFIDPAAATSGPGT